MYLHKAPYMKFKKTICKYDRGVFILWPFTIFTNVYWSESVKFTSGFREHGRPAQRLNAKTRYVYTCGTTRRDYKFDTVGLNGYENSVQYTRPTPSQMQVFRPIRGNICYWNINARCAYVMLYNFQIMIGASTLPVVASKFVRSNRSTRGFLFGRVIWRFSSLKSRCTGYTTAFVCIRILFPTWRSSQKPNPEYLLFVPERIYMRFETSLNRFFSHVRSRQMRSIA